MIANRYLHYLTSIDATEADNLLKTANRHRNGTPIELPNHDEYINGMPMSSTLGVVASAGLEKAVAAYDMKQGNDGDLTLVIKVYGRAADF